MFENVENWSCNITERKLGPEKDFMLVFTSPIVGTNFIFTLSQLRELVDRKEKTRIPMKVLVEALDRCQPEHMAAA